MTIVQNPLTGQMSGSVVNFVTSTLNGKNVVRSKAFKHKDANSPAQQTQRLCFKMIGEIYQSLGGVIKEGFAESSKSSSVYTKFISENLQTAFDKSNETPKVDYSQLVVACGTLPVVTVSESRVDVDGLLISFQSNINILLVNTDDKIVALALLTSGELLYCKQERTAEKVNSILLEKPGMSTDDIKCFYIYALNASSTKVSRSQFVCL